MAGNVDGAGTGSGSISLPRLVQRRGARPIRYGHEAIVCSHAHRDVSGRLLGFTQLYPTFCSVAAGPIYVLYDVFVSPESRSTGVGRTLLRAAVDYAAATAAVRLELATAKTNSAAQKLY